MHIEAPAAMEDIPHPQSFSAEPMSAEALVPPSGSLRSVLIVGSGVAGLQCCREVLKLGLDVCVLEANADIGGVWTRNYAGFGLQVPWRMYEFPEFPWPRELEPQSEYPSGEEVHGYIRAYARAFGLYDHVRLNCKLLRLRWQPLERRWEAVYVDTVREKFFRLVADYVVVASGIYSQPYVPTYEVRLGRDQAPGDAGCECPLLMARTGEAGFGGGHGELLQLWGSGEAQLHHQGPALP